MSDDRSEDSKYVSWARACKVKFNFTCCICNAKDVYLESHHISSWDWDIENRYNLDNSACLCAQCHKHFHHIFGYGGNHQFQFEQFKKIYLIFKTMLSRKPEISPSVIATEKNNI